MKKIKEIKEKFLEIVNDYVEDAKEVRRILQEKYEKELADPKKQKKYLIIASFLLGVTVLIANIFNSFAYYYDESEGYTLIEATVGRMYIDEYDYTLLVFVESETEEGFFELSATIPNTGYVFNGYSCLNNSNLIYNDPDKTTKATLTQKDVCSIYFKRSK